MIHETAVMIDWMSYWSLIVLATYPLVGLALFTSALLLTSSDRLRQIHKRHPASVWMLVLVAALYWPSWLAKSVRKRL